MPDRLIRESALTSETLAGLSDFAERLFWRLTTVADDYGRFVANASVVAGRCMPLVNGATTKRIEAALLELESAEAIKLYEIDGKRYLHFPQWSKYQQTRAKKSKYPDPPDLQASADICLQTQTIVSDFAKAASAPHTHTHTDSSSEILTPEIVEPEDLFDQAWAYYPKRIGTNSKADARKAWSARIEKGVSADEMLAGCIRYREFCDGTEKSDTDFVMQACRFFGPGEHWKQDWPLPRASPNLSPGNANIDRFIRRKQQEEREHDRNRSGENLGNGQRQLVSTTGR